MVNSARILGHLGRDPETGETSRGTRYCGLSVATARKWTDKASGEKREKTTWHRVVVWGDGLANECAKRLKKGSKVYVEGEIETRDYEDRDGVKRYVTEIVVQGLRGQVVFLDSGSGGAAPPMPEEAPDDYREREMVGV